MSSDPRTLLTGKLTPHKFLKFLQLGIADSKPPFSIETEFLNEAARNDSESFFGSIRGLIHEIENEEYETTASDFVGRFASSFFYLPGLVMAGYIGEAPLKVYLYRLLWYSFNSEKRYIDIDEGVFNDKFDPVIKKIKATVVDEIRTTFGLPFKLDALKLYFNNGLWDEEEKLRNEMEHWIYPDED